MRKGTERTKTENRKSRETQTGKPIRLTGSLTVEAAVVVSLTLIAIASMLMMEFRLHDRLAARNALLCALECYSYRNPDRDSVDQIRQAANSEDHFILNSHPAVEISPGFLSFDARGGVHSETAQDGESTVHFRTETLLRASVLLELKGSVKKETGTDAGTVQGTGTLQTGSGEGKQE